jgi:tetratricopeptide (TPR) repeat protein
MKPRDPMTPRLNEEAEERLRPSRFLGFDRDHIGVFLLSKEMYDVAEAQFRRAAYLNPYESAFLQHLAWALYKQEKLEAARRAVDECLKRNPEDRDATYIRGRIIAKLKG